MTPEERDRAINYLLDRMERKFFGSTRGSQFHPAEATPPRGDECRPIEPGPRLSTPFGPVLIIGTYS